MNDRRPDGVRAFWSRETEEKVIEALRLLHRDVLPDWENTWARTILASIVDNLLPPGGVRRIEYAHGHSDPPRNDVVYRLHPNAGRCDYCNIQRDLVAWHDDLYSNDHWPRYVGPWLPIEPAENE